MSGLVMTNIDREYCDHMTFEEFQSCVESGMFIDYDGFGNLATADQESNIEIYPSLLSDTYERPEWATHVCWYNR